MNRRILERRVRIHLSELLKNEGRKDRKSQKMLEKAWKSKEQLFESNCRKLGLDNIEELVDTQRGFLALTVSGSILACGPVEEDSRTVLYYSTGIRKELPLERQFNDVSLASSVRIGSILSLSGGLQKTSELYRLAVFSNEARSEDIKGTLIEAAKTIVQGFVKVNTIHS